MSDNFDKELEEIIRIVNSDHTRPAEHRQKPHNSQQSPKHSNRNKTARQLSRIKKRKKQYKVRKWTVLGCIIAVLVLLIVFICKSCAGGKDATTNLEGVWYYDQYTEYEFDSEGNGCMCLDGNSHFEFTYKTKNDTLYLDFVLDYVTDCQYTYVVNGDKLTLVGGAGTAEVGKVYELTKE